MAYIKPTDKNKAWAQRTMTNKRELRQFDIRNLFRIYCEGENTEPEYFRSFPVNTETRVEAIGLARSKTSLVKKAIELLEKDELLKGRENYDSDRQLWVVFDYDTRGLANEAADFNKAINLAEQKGINVAYSNDSFELWFVLHYQFTDNALTRKEYYDILSGKLNCNYEQDGKTKDFAKALYAIYLPQQQQAINHANRLYEQMQHKTYADQNPCTTVFKLVMELNKCLKK
ncbi:MAG: RloB family protein [Salinivirgaceae bacterium]